MKVWDIVAAEDVKKAPFRPAPTRRLTARLWSDYLSKYWPRLALAIAAMVFYALSASAIPVGLEWINSAFSGDNNRFSAAPADVLVWGPVLIIALGAVNAAAQYLQTRLSLGAALSTLRDLQRDMFAQISVADLAQIRAETSGQIMSRFTNDPMVLRETLTRAARAVSDLFTLIGLCAVMVYYDWLLFAVVIAVYAIIGWPVAKIGRYLRRKSAETQEQAGEVASLVSETVTGARLVKAYQLETAEKTRADGAFERRLGLLKNIGYARALNEPVIFFVGAMALAVVVAVVALRILSGAINGPQFISFIVALLMLSQPARGLSTLHAVMQEGFGAFERMLGVIDITPQVTDAPGAEDLSIAAGAVAFEKVRFSYEEGGPPALQDFSLTVPAGAVVALVGESGAGKSTLFNLLPRLYDATGGAITIDGQNIAGVTRASLRRALALVSQDAFLFNDTVRANIAMGRPGADDAAIMAAAKAAAADEFINALPQQYETRVGEGGGNLSGGQRQRIALARAFLKDAPILLLDEATSALDAEAEAKVQRALERLSSGRTTIVIAHRLSTVRGADLIAVMAEGRVIETGAHDELMQRNETYARLVALQLSGAQDGE